MKALIDRKTKKEHYYLEKSEIEEIKNFIIETCITQKELAKELNKYQSDYSEYETGKIELDYEKIVYLCNRLDISPNDLFGIY